MDTANIPQPRPAASPPAARRWFALGTAMLLAALGWYAWRWYSTPVPPVIDLGTAGDPRLAQVVEEARQQVVQQPRSAAAWGHLGQLLLAHAYVVEAKPCLAQAEALDPTDPRWPYLQGWGDLLNHPEDAAPEFERAVARAGGDALREETARLRLAQTLLDRGELTAADAQFRVLLGSQHADAPAHLGLGSVALDTGDLDGAVLHLESATSSPLCRKRACAQLAAAYRRRGNRALADEWDRRAHQLRKDAEWPDPFLREGEQLIVSKRMRMLRAENLMREGQVEEAAERFWSLIADYPDDTQARTKLALLLSESGKPHDAERVLRELLRVKDDMVQGHFLLSVVLFQQAEKSQSKEQFRAAAAEARRTIALAPNHGFAYVYLGLSLRHLGELDKAIKALQDAARCNPEAVDPHLHLGETLAQANRRDEAIREIEDAVRVAPSSDRRPRQALKRLRGAAGK
jgi:tetratricopeptide (TPR) repeat protein